MQYQELPQTVEEALIQEKGDAAELVLDGHLIGEQTSEVNLAELLEVARKEFDADQAAAAHGWMRLNWRRNGPPCACRLPKPAAPGVYAVWIS